MIDFYEILGVKEDASPEEIKKAFQRRAHVVHPDKNPEDAQAAQQQFRELTEAYHVLRDASKRATYDMMRRAGFTSTLEEGPGGPSTSYRGRPPFGGGRTAAGARHADFDAAFDQWWQKMGQQFKDYAEERMEQEQTEAERMARAAAWEREKEEAKLNKVRAERLRQKTEDARHTRHAAILRRFWQTHGGLTWYDAGFTLLCLCGVGGMAYVWKQHLSKEPLQQQGQQQTPPTGTTMAAAATQADPP